MIVISKDDKLEWVVYLVIGYLGVWFLPSTFLILLENDFSAFIKFPLALLASGVTLYAFKKYLGWYVEDGARLSAFGQLHKVGVGWLVSALYLFTTLTCLFATKHYSVAYFNFNLNNQLGWFSIYLLAAVIEEIIARGIVFKLITDKWNVVAGLVVSSIVFGFVHLFQPQHHRIVLFKDSNYRRLVVWHSLCLPSNVVGSHWYPLGLELHSKQHLRTQRARKCLKQPSHSYIGFERSKVSCWYRVRYRGFYHIHSDWRFHIRRLYHSIF